MIVYNQINPFQQLASESKATSTNTGSTDLSPVDPDACFGYEMCRLESFKKQNRQTFAGMKVEEMANAGFYLNGEGTTVRCPRCKIELTEEKFERIILTRPVLPGSPLNDEPWTAMRVHRHENGQMVDGNHPWCPWVRREPDGLYPNVLMVIHFEIISYKLSLRFSRMKVECNILSIQLMLRPKNELNHLNQIGSIRVVLVYRM